MTRVAVIIVNFNAGDRLLKCLAALEAQTRPADAVFVADNASTDGSAKKAQAAFPSATFLFNDSNLGFAEANNRAVAAVDTEWVALLNPDAYPEPGWLEALFDAATTTANVGAVGSLQIDALDPARLDGAGDNLHVFGVPYRGFLHQPLDHAPPSGVVLSPCAAAALYRRDLFLELGGFDGRFFCYCEDVDLGARFHHYGYETVQANKAVVHHEGSAITGRQSDFTVYHGHRNRVWLFAKTMPPLLFWLMLPAHLLVNLAFVVKFAPTPIGRSYRRGIIDGLRAMPRLRRERKGKPSLTSWGFARLLVWSPFALMARRGKVLPRR
ncbi:MAG: glycosyltransferase family 2 protein [Pseudomonadota bacterium]